MRADMCRRETEIPHALEDGMFWVWGLGANCQVLLRNCMLAPDLPAQRRKRMSEGETELHEDPEANIGREVSYHNGSSLSKVPLPPPSRIAPSLPSRARALPGITHA